MVDAVGETGMRMWLEHEEPMLGGSALEWRWKLMLACGAFLVADGVAGSAGLTGVALPLYLAGAAAGIIYPLRRAVTSARSRILDINVLMVIAVAGALALGDWSEATSVVFLFAVAQWLEVRTMDRARQAIRSLVDLTPPEALVPRHGREQRVSGDTIAPGDEIVIRPGEKVPLDGLVTTGRSDVNEAPLTGESRPIDKAPGDEVYAGTINGRGAMEGRVLRLGRDSRLARIIHLVETAPARPPPAQPVAAAITRHAHALLTDLPPVRGFASLPGMGAEGEVDGRRVAIGNERFFDTNGIGIPAPWSDADRLRGEGKSLVFVAADGVALGAIAVADRPRETARETIEMLRTLHVSSVAMLTGDHEETAAAIARELQVDEYHAALLPEQKQAMVESMRAAHGALMMVGDGVNDAPALAAADVGVAMGAAGSHPGPAPANVADVVPS